MDNMTKHLVVLAVLASVCASVGRAQFWNVNNRFSHNRDNRRQGQDYPKVDYGNIGISQQNVQWVCTNPKTQDVMIIAAEDTPKGLKITHQPSNPQNQFNNYYPNQFQQPNYPQPQQPNYPQPLQPNYPQPEQPNYPQPLQPNYPQPPSYNFPQPQQPNNPQFQPNNLPWNKPEVVILDDPTTTTTPIPLTLATVPAEPTTKKSVPSTQPTLPKWNEDDDNDTIEIITG